MDLSAILQTAIGLAAMYWLLATACSFFLEFVNSLRNIRGTSLTLFIYDMAGARLRTTSLWSRLARWVTFRSKGVTFVDDRVESSAWVGSAVVSHPLVRSYEKPNWRRDSGNTPPSYLPAGVFANALVDTLRQLLRLTPTGYEYLLGKTSLPDDQRSRLIAALRAGPKETAGSAIETLIDGIKELALRSMLTPLFTRPARVGIFDVFRKLIRMPRLQLLKYWLFAFATKLAKLKDKNWDSAPIEFGLISIDVDTRQRESIESARKTLTALQALQKSFEDGVFDVQLPYSDFFERLLGHGCPGLPPNPSESMLETWLEGNQGKPWLRELLRLLLSAGRTRAAVQSVLVNNIAATAAVDAALAASLRELSFSDLRAAIESPIVPKRLRDLLHPLLYNAAHDLTEARKAIESWYDGVMDRASGWYKRHCMFSLAIIALVPVVLFNIDSVQIGNRLLSDAGFRSIWEQTAMEIYSEPTKMTTWVRQNAALFAVNKGGPLANADQSYVDMSSREKDAVVKEAKAVLGATVAETDLAPALIFASDKKTLNEKDAAIFKALFDAGCGNVEQGPAKDKCKAFSNGKLSSSLDDIFADGLLVSDIGTMQPLRDFIISATDAASRSSKARQEKVGDPAEAKRNDDLDFKLTRLRDALFEKNPSAMAAVNFTLGPSPEWVRSVIRLLRITDAELREVEWTKLTSSGLLLRDVVGSCFGWLLTALMISLGAPFWFDLIGKIANMRGAGEKPAHAAQ